ncbi:MAG: DUF58 domain-containing protein [Chloroflexia bacterium]
MLPPELVRRLRALNLASRTRRPGQRKGDRRSPKRGSSVEFADNRSYSPGDDLRRVDWNLYARTDKLFIKVYDEEEDRAVYLLIDSGASMGFGEPSKLLLAQRITAALGYVALHEMDRVYVSQIGGGPLRWSRPLRGGPSVPRLLEFLGGLTPNGGSSVRRALEEQAGRFTSPGLVILVSDLMDPSGLLPGLRALAGRGHELTVLHVLAPEELDPGYVGDLELVDSETGSKQSVTIDRAAVEAYDHRLNAWLEEVRRDCLAVDAAYIQTSSDTPVEELLLGELRKRKVLV